MGSPVEHRYPQSFKVHVGNQKGHLPKFTKNKSKQKLRFKIICYRKNERYKKFLKVYLYKSVYRVVIVKGLHCLRTFYFYYDPNQFSFIIRMVSSTNHSDNKAK